MATSHQRADVLATGIPGLGGQPSIFAAFQLEYRPRQSSQRFTNGDRLIVERPIGPPFKRQDADGLAMRVEWNRANDPTSVSTCQIVMRTRDANWLPGTRGEDDRRLLIQSFFHRGAES